jgi:hypothetical protein
MTKDIFDLVASLEAEPDRPRAPTFRRPRDQGALRLLALNRGSGASSTFLPRHVCKGVSGGTRVAFFNCPVSD